MTAEEARKKTEQRLVDLKSWFFDYCIQQIQEQIEFGKSKTVVSTDDFSFSEEAEKKLKSLGYKVKRETASYTANRYLWIYW